MSRYRRAQIPGGTFFFTVALADRSSDALVRHVDLLRRMYASTQKNRPFETIAICILPDHLHAIWSLPANDADFSVPMEPYQERLFARSTRFDIPFGKQDCQTREGYLAATILGTSHPR